MSKKDRELKRIKAELGIEKKRGATFVGCRPTFYADKSKYNRKRDKSSWKRELCY